MNELSQEDTNKLAELIFAGQKIEAIKICREITGLGLREAKEFVENLEAQLHEENPTFPLHLASTAQPPRPSMGNMPEDDAQKMTELIFAGQKIGAIKMYKEATSLGLKESKQFIDALEKQLREECPDNFAHAAGSGCSIKTAAVILLMVALAGVVGWV